jgi:hypothetical protein
VRILDSYIGSLSSLPYGLCINTLSVKTVLNSRHACSLASV